MAGNAKAHDGISSANIRAGDATVDHCPSRAHELAFIRRQKPCDDDTADYFVSAFSVG